MEAHGYQAVAASNQSSYKSREEPSRKSSDHQHRVVQLARSDKGHLIFSNYFSRFSMDSSCNSRHNHNTLTACNSPIQL